MTKTTLKDIALKAGISLSAVSRVLNNKNSLVSEKTKEKVLAIARECNYQPNLFAKSLKTGRTHIIGITSGTERPLAEMFGQPYMNAIFAGLGDVLTDQDYKLIFYRIKATDPQHPATDIAQSRLVDGLVFILLADFFDYFQKNKLPLLRALHIPFVVVTSFKQDFGLPFIGLDCVAGGQTAARHFIEHGYQEFGFVTRQRPNIFYNDLKGGYLAALADYGVTGKSVQQYECKNIFVSDGDALAGRLLHERVRLPRAFFCVEDHLALGMMRRFRATGLSIPDDVAFIGFGDLIDPNRYPHDLTSVRQPAHEKGEQAGQLLLRILQSPPESPCPESIIMAPPLVIRQSCGCIQKTD